MYDVLRPISVSTEYDDTFARHFPNLALVLLIASIGLVIDSMKLRLAQIDKQPWVSFSWFFLNSIPPEMVKTFGVIVCSAHYQNVVINMASKKNGCGL